MRVCVCAVCSQTTTRLWLYAVWDGDWWTEEGVLRDIRLNGYANLTLSQIIIFSFLFAYAILCININTWRCRQWYTHTHTQDTLLEDRRRHTIRTHTLGRAHTPCRHVDGRRRQIALPEYISIECWCLDVLCCVCVDCGIVLYRFNASYGSKLA